MAYNNTKIGYNKNLPTISERPDRTISKLIKSNFVRGRKIISDWIAANNAAGNVSSPKRTLLYSIYDECSIDGEIHSEWETKRKLRFTSVDFNLFDVNNKPNEEASKLLQTMWFSQLLSYALDSKLYGHSLVEIKDIDQDGKIIKLELVPRRHVVPEKGLITIKVGDEKGLLFREEQSIVQWIFEIGEDTDLGILNKCVPYVLFMRFALSAWSEFAELFAMPLRVGKTQSKDNASLNRMEQMLIDMATGAYAVIDKEEEIEFVQAGKNDGTVFDRLIQVCTEKISKIINGAVVGQASQGGSLAKEEVGQQIANLVTGSDLKWFENWMNTYGIPKLISLGYPLQGLRFEFKKTKDLNTMADVLVKLSQAGYQPTDEWVQDEFGIPLKPIANIKPTANSDLNFFD